MKKFLLVLVLLAAVFYWGMQRFALSTGKSPDGAYNAILVDKSSGQLYRLMGK